MTAEQVLRAKIIKTLRGFTYEELAFHLVDSRCYRHFCRIGVAHAGFAKSTLHGAIKALSAQTLEAINRLLMAYGEDKEIEKGRDPASTAPSWTPPSITRPTPPCSGTQCVP